MLCELVLEVVKIQQFMAIIDDYLTMKLGFLATAILSRFLFDFITKNDYKISLEIGCCAIISDLNYL